MTDFSAVSLRIGTVGDREALAALDNLDKRGRRIVEDAAGAMGRAMGDVAVFYETGSKRVRRALEDIAEGHRQNIKELQAEERATERALNSVASQTERLASRNEHALASASRGLEMLGRTGRLTGRSLDAVVGQISQMAFAFGPGGQLVAAIGITTAAIVEMFMRTERESAKLAEATAKNFERIAGQSVQQQGEQAAELYNGNPNAADPLDRFGVKGLRQQRAQLEARVKRGTSTFYGAHAIATTQMTDDAKDAYETLSKVKDKLAEIEPLYASIVGGLIQRTGKKEAADNLPGFITDQMKENEAAAKRAAAAWNKAVKAFSDGIEERKKAFDQLVASEIARLTNADDPNLSTNERLERANRRMDAAAGNSVLPDMKQVREQVKAMMHDEHFDLGQTISQQIKNDPFLKSQAASEKLGKELGLQLGGGLTRGLEAGFAAAFSGKGVTGFLEGFGQSMLKTLGEIFIKQGEALIDFASIMKAVSGMLTNPVTSGWGLAIEGAALIALGSALSAAAGGGHGGGGGGYGSGGSAGGLPQIIDRGVISPSAYSSSDPRSIPTKPSVTNNVTIIGPNDPQAQRMFDELQRKSQQRGSLAGGLG